MKKCIKLILVCLLLINYSCVYAVDIDMNINNIENTSTLIDTTNTNSTNTANILNNSSTAKVSTSQTSEDFTLSVSDIINIILISVGIVLIFLAIAILLKIR